MTAVHANDCMRNAAGWGSGLEAESLAAGRGHDGRAREEVVGVDGAAALADFVVQVGGGDAAGRAGGSDDLAHADILAGDDVDAGEVGVEGAAAAAVVDHNHPAVGAGPLGLLDDAVGGDADWSAHGGSDVDAGMEGLQPAKGIVAAAEVAEQAAVDGPKRGDGILEPAAVDGTAGAGQGGGLEEVVFLEALADAGHEALRGVSERARRARH